MQTECTLTLFNLNLIHPRNTKVLPSSPPGA